VRDRGGTGRKSAEGESAYLKSAAREIGHAGSSPARGTTDDWIYQVKCAIVANKLTLTYALRDCRCEQPSFRHLRRFGAASPTRPPRTPDPT
jgi:hypothetical protein